MGEFEELPIRWDAAVATLPDLRLFLADLDRPGARPPPVELDGEETARLERLRDPLTRRRFLGRRRLLRRLLSEACGVPAEAIRYRYAQHGKPDVANLAPGEAFHFNSSSSERWYAVATSRAGPVGVDIEATGRRIDYGQVLDAAAGSEERAWHAAATGRTAALLAMRIWVAKEAVLKAAGSGLQIDLRTISLPRELLLAESPRAWTRVFLRGFDRPFLVQLVMVDQAVLALARSSTGGAGLS